jgi:hypothetical protein
MSQYFAHQTQSLKVPIGEEIITIKREYAPNFRLFG